MRAALVLLLIALFTGAHADQYLTNKTLVATERIQGSPIIIKQIENQWTQPISYYYQRDKETCFSWSVSLSVLRKFNLSTSREGCRSQGTYTASGTLGGGYTVSIYMRRIRDYDTYYAQRIRVQDDGTSSVVASTSATKRDDFESYWKSTSR